ncbi:MAG: M20/M25/M40 family metallo-hydrolase, partial [Pseudomonadota bacterium]
EAVFSVVIRDTDEAVMEALKAEFLDSVERAAQTHRLRAALAQRSWIKPVALDPELRRIFRQAAEARGLAYREMPSGAGHDAQTMAALCPSALVFVPSHDGISHSPGEHTDWHYIPPAAQLMLDALIRISDARPRATGD